MHDLDRTRAELEPTLEDLDARGYEDDPADEHWAEDEHGFERHAGGLGGARELELAARLLELVAQAARQEARHLAPGARDAAAPAGALCRCGIAHELLGSSGRWVRRGRHILLLDA